MKLAAFYAWISIDPEGREGLLFSRNIEGEHTPLLSPSLEHIEFYRPVAEKSRESGCRIELVRWAARETLEELP